ncbi:hypothetical protein sce1858 [Sorangium cellulosum So ce56]|uniref:Uncharacterized protein n=1 Tax=Sorangium cellulosum (strain So ce56) TaxID=448385 RepID=A9FP23_SORC5|nr:hypothetical protein sce1858 [Sorangium cellulosum So ce56]
MNALFCLSRNLTAGPPCTVGLFGVPLIVPQ